MSILQSTIQATALGATPLLLAGLGELLEERVGILNIGLEGLMLIGAVVGFGVTIKSGSPNLGLLAGALAGGVIVLVFSIPVVFLNTDQILPGFALWLIGLGLSAAYGNDYVSSPMFSTLGPTHVPLLDRLPEIGRPLFVNPWPVYFAVVLSILAAVLIAHTRHGLNMRAVGSDPISADAAGVAVLRLRFLYSILTGLLTGFGGAFLSIVLISHWQESMTAGRGFMALALVILSRWHPLLLILGAYAFGLFLYLADLGQALGWPVSSEFLEMAPYAITFVVLVLTSLRQARRPGASLAPAALGRPFIRGHA